MFRFWFFPVFGFGLGVYSNLDDDTIVTGGMNRLDTRMIIVQHVAYKPH